MLPLTIKSAKQINTNFTTKFYFLLFQKITFKTFLNIKRIVFNSKI